MHIYVFIYRSPNSMCKILKNDNYAFKAVNSQLNHSEVTSNFQ